MNTAPGETQEYPFDAEPLPKHIAIIMDGNGRWARGRGQPRVLGHQAGAESVRVISKTCSDWNIPFLTLYGFSSENWSRPAAEVDALMHLIRNTLRKSVDHLHENNVRLRAIGDLARLPQSLQDELQRSVDKLQNNQGLTLTLALSYGSRDEILRAMRAWHAAVQEGRADPERLNEGEFATYLDTAGIPDPDLLIRTAGEQRLSNYLLWQLAYAEFYFTELCWPAFREDALAEAIRAFQQRLRKYGRTAEQVAQSTGER